MTFAPRPDANKTPPRNTVIIELRIAVATVESTPPSPSFPKIATRDAEAADISA